MVQPAGNDSGGECGVTTAARFPMPGAIFPFNHAATNASLEDAADNHHHHHHHHHHRKGEPYQNPPFWYSFDYGSAHFTVISGEHDITDGSDQFMVSNLRAYLLWSWLSSLPGWQYHLGLVST